MNQRFILFRRAGVFYCEDATTGKQTSLRTKDIVRSRAYTLLRALSGQETPQNDPSKWEQ
jgi:hypothetical protein